MCQKDDELYKKMQPFPNSLSIIKTLNNEPHS